MQATFFKTLIDEWVRGGIQDAVVAPGNRSTLLSLLFVEDRRIRVHVVVDERSASFFALGIAKATGRPTVVWTTSGTATAELHPAVIEAHHSHVPLLVCTSDRPPELHHARDWQSIDQSKLYGDTLRWRFDPGVADEAMSGTWRSIGARSVVETLRNPHGPGPVHLNLPIREPWTAQSGELPKGRANQKAWHQILGVELRVAESPKLKPQTKGLFVVGESSVDPDVLHLAARRLGWPVVADLRSGCRVESETTVFSYDLLANSAQFCANHNPDLVVHIGAPLISKPFNTWLAGCNAEHWFVNPFNDWAGGMADSHQILQLDPTIFCEGLDGEAAPNQWLQAWRRADLAIAEELDATLGGGAISEPSIARQLVGRMRDGQNLFAATSMPVRDIETYGGQRNDLHVYANRGASGMDGLVSTATGIAVGTGRPTVMLTGDLSFLYDVGALWALHDTYTKANLAIVVIDNNGGGIFSGLPQLATIDPDVFERVVATPHHIDIPSVVRGFGVECMPVTKMADLMPAVEDALAHPGISVVYVSTDRGVQAMLRKRIANSVNVALR